MVSKRSTMQSTTKEHQIAFLNEFAQSGHVGNSAAKVPVDRTTVYLWREDPEFEKLFELARKRAVTVLEDEAHRRAFSGVDEPVFYKGSKCGVVRKYSDTLLIVLLKANAPEKYRERIENSFDNSKPLEITVRWDGNKRDEIVKENKL